VRRGQRRNAAKPDIIREASSLYNKVYTKRRTDLKKTNACNAKSEPRNLFNFTDSWIMLQMKTELKWRIVFLVKPLVSALLGSVGPGPNW